MSERYAKGELSYSKVRAITRIATPENEDYLLMIARHGTAFHVEGLVSKYRRCKRLEDVETANRQQARRKFTWFYDDDGSLVVHGRFPAEQGALIVKALELATDRRDREIEAERRVLRTAAAHAKAVAAAEGADHVSAETRASPCGDVSAETPSADVSVETAIDEVCAGSRQRLYYSDAAEEVRGFEPFPVRHADALRQLAETYLVHGPKSSNTADRYQVVAHVSAETARRLGCDASKIEVTDDEDGEPLNIGRKSRIVPPGMRRALRLRDDGCRFPGGTHKHFIDGHHIRHWADGGETGLNNLVQLCRFHHRLVHEQGFGCKRGSDGHVFFTNPYGDKIPDSGFLPSIKPDADPLEHLKDDLHGLEIDPETCVPKWQGESMDWPLAVGHLFDH